MSTYGKNQKAFYQRNKLKRSEYYKNYYQLNKEKYRERYKVKAMAKTLAKVEEKTEAVRLEDKLEII